MLMQQLHAVLFAVHWMCNTCNACEAVWIWNKITQALCIYRINEKNILP